MNIKYKDQDVEISIKNINKDSKEELESVAKIIELLKEFKKPMQYIFGSLSEDNNTSAKENNIIHEKSKIDDRPILRERIPNQVDLSNLEIKKAVTEEPMIRCPNCGQSSKVIVKIEPTANYLLRKVTKNNKKTFETVLELTNQQDIDNILLPENSDITAYHNDIMKIKPSKKLKDTDLNVNNETLLLCPCCHKEMIFKSWVEAYKYPLDFDFETDVLCEVCGHEAVKTIDKNKHAIIQCEHCGHKEDII
jgi:DNA-directed RNA polymerase subunit RPC12/RpoP